jgi:hypothetical protein
MCEWPASERNLAPAISSAARLASSCISSASPTQMRHGTRQALRSCETGPSTWPVRHAASSAAGLQARETSARRHCRLGDGPAGDQKHVVGNAATGRSVGQMLSRIDRDKRPMREGRARSGSQLRQLEMNDLSELERLGDGERPVPEVRFGRARSSTLPRSSPSARSARAASRAATPPPAISTFAAPPLTIAAQIPGG